MWINRYKTVIRVQFRRGVNWNHWWRTLGRNTASISKHSQQLCLKREAQLHYINICNIKAYGNESYSLIYTYFILFQLQQTNRWYDSAEVKNSIQLNTKRRHLDVGKHKQLIITEYKQDATLSLRRPRDAPNIWVPWKLCVSTKAVDDCTRISTLRSYHYSAVKVFSKYSNKCDHGT